MQCIQHTFYKSHSIFKWKKNLNNLLTHEGNAYHTCLYGLASLVEPNKITKCVNENLVNCTKCVSHRKENT